MLEHLRVLGWLGIVRGVLGALAGAFIIWRAVVPAVPQEALPWDVPLFWVVGIVSLLLAVVWTAQGVAVLRMRPWSRRCGLFLGLTDLVCLCFFPVSTAMGLYAIVVYRHGETVEHFRSRARPSAQALQRNAAGVK